MSNKLTPPTIDQMARGQVGNVRATIRACAENRSIHRFCNRGFTKKKTMRFVAMIPVEYKLRFWGCPECRGYGWDDWKRDKGVCSKCNGKGLIPNPYYKEYFDVQMDSDQSRKARNKFLRREKPEFMTVDRL